MGWGPSGWGPAPASSNRGVRENAILRSDHKKEFLHPRNHNTNNIANTDYGIGIVGGQQLHDSNKGGSSDSCFGGITSTSSSSSMSSSSSLSLTEEHFNPATFKRRRLCHNNLCQDDVVMGNDENSIPMTLKSLSTMGPPPNPYEDVDFVLQLLRNSGVQTKKDVEKYCLKMKIPHLSRILKLDAIQNMHA